MSRLLLIRTRMANNNRGNQLKFTVQHLLNGNGGIQEGMSPRLIADNLGRWDGRYAVEFKARIHPRCRFVTDGTIFWVCSAALPERIGLKVYSATLSERKQDWVYTFTANRRFAIHCKTEVSPAIKPEYRVSAKISEGRLLHMNPRLPIKGVSRTATGRSVVDLRELAEVIRESPTDSWRHYFQWTWTSRVEHQVGKRDTLVNIMTVYEGSPRSEPIEVKAPVESLPDRDIPRKTAFWVPLGWAIDVYKLHCAGDVPPRSF